MRAKAVFFSTIFIPLKWESAWRPPWDIWEGADEGCSEEFAERTENRRSRSPSLDLSSTKPSICIKSYLVSKHLFIVITHQGNIRKLLNRRGEFISLLFTPGPVLAQIGGVREGDREGENSFIWIKQSNKKDLHTEEVSEGGGGALPEVLPAEVVLLRSLHCATQTRQVQFKTKQQSLLTENRFSFKSLADWKQIFLQKPRTINLNI